MRRSSVRLGALAVAAALMAACGSDDPADTATSAAAGGEEPQAGGSLTLLQNYEPPTLDPAVMGNQLPTNALVGNSLYGQLLIVGSDGQVEPVLAESLESSDGGTTWRLTLREGLTFSDGTPFDAEAVRVNWERLKDPSTRSMHATYASLIESTTPSARTLEFTLVRPIGQFGTVIAQNLNWIASPQALRAGPEAFSDNPIGAGPFVLDSWQRGGELVLSRNPDYYEESLPHLDELVIVTNNDSEQRLSSVVAGGADGALLSSADQLVRAEEQDMQITHADMAGSSTVFSYNVRIAPFDDVRARQAVAQAVDWDLVNGAVYSGNGEVPGTWFAEDSERNGDTTLPGHDPEAAQELLDELAAEGEPLRFVITTPQSTEPRRASESIQAQLSQYDNIEVDLEVLDSATVRTKTAQKDYQVGFTAIFGDPVFLYNTFHGQSPANLSGISDPELDAALVTVLEAPDEEAATEGYERVAERLDELMPGLPYTRQIWGLAHTGQVRGAEFYGGGSLRTDTLWLAE